MRKTTIVIAVTALGLLLWLAAARAFRRPAASAAPPASAARAERPAWDWRQRTTPDVIVASRDGGLKPYFPSVARVGPRELIVVYYASPGHTDQTGKILLKRSVDDGQTWSAAVTAVDTPYDDRDPSVMVTRSGRVILSYFSRDWLRTPPTVWGTFVVSSDDRGHTWSPPAPVGTKLGWSGTSAPVLELAGGDLLLPLYGGLHGETASRVTVVRSSDGGRTWPASSEVEVAADPAIDFEEPALVVGADESIRVLMRTDRADGHGYEAESKDGGGTWSVPVKLAIKPHAPDLFPVTLADGSRAIFGSWGDVAGGFGVGRAVVARVRAGGRTSDEALLYRGDCGDESYPSATQLDDGRLFVVYYDACADIVGATYFSFASPSVRRVYPTAGPVEGGTTVHLEGEHFERGMSVLVGGFPARAVTVLSRTTAVLQMPARPAGVTDITIKPIAGPRVQIADAFTFVDRGWTTLLLPNRDADDDGIPDRWELRFSLDPRGAGDASLDPDGDGASNAEEYRRQSHPVGLDTQYFAAGSTRNGIRTRFVMANPTRAAAVVLLRFVSTNGVQTRDAIVPPLSVREIEAAPFAASDFATAIESDVRLAVKRVMEAGGGTSSHAEGGLTPSRTWYFGAAPAGAALRVSYWLHNPAGAPAAVNVVYRTAEGREHARSRTVPAGALVEIALAEEAKDLAGAGVSARIEATVPIIAERIVSSGAASAACAGSPVAGPQWFLAEGANASDVRTTLSVANFADAPAEIELQYFLRPGYVSTSHALTRGTHMTIPLSREAPDLQHVPDVWTSLAAGAAGRVALDRWVSWGAHQQTDGMHCSSGFPEAGHAWVVPLQTLRQDLQAFAIIANVSSRRADLRVTLLRNDSTTQQRSYQVQPLERLTIDIADTFPDGRHRATALLVESPQSAPVIVEASSYLVRSGGTWADGSSARAVRLSTGGPPPEPPAPPAYVPRTQESIRQVEARVGRAPFTIPARNRFWGLEPAGFALEPPFAGDGRLKMYVRVLKRHIRDDLRLNMYPDGDPTRLLAFFNDPVPDFSEAQVGDVVPVTFPLSLAPGLYQTYTASRLTPEIIVPLGWVVVGDPRSSQFTQAVAGVRARGDVARAEEIERLVDVTNRRR